MRFVWLAIPLAAVLLGTTLTTYTQPTAIQSAFGTAASGTSASLTFTQTPTAGDVLLCSAAHTAGTGASVTFPAGFTAIGSQSNVTTLLGVVQAYHVIAGGDPSTYAATTSVSVGDLVFGCVEYAYVNTSAPIMAQSCTADPAPSTSESTPLQTPTLPAVASNFFAAIGSGTTTIQNGAAPNYDTTVGSLLAHSEHSTPLYAFQNPYSASLTYSAAPSSAISCTALLNPNVTPFTIGVVSPVVTPTPIAPSPTPAPTTPPFGSAPTHVMTAEYMWSAWEKVTSNYASAAPYLTYGYFLYSDMLAGHNAGIKAVTYTDPWQPSAISSQDPIEYGLITKAAGTAYQNALATTCGGTVITTYGGNYRLANVLSSYSNGSYTVQNAAAFVAADFAGYTTTVKNSNGGTDATDVFFTDNGDDYGASATPCGVSTTRTSTWAQGLANTVTAAAPPHHIFVNALGVWTTSWVSAQLNVLNSSYVDGAEDEACYGGHGYGSQISGDFIDGTDKLWYYEQQAEIGTINKSKIFWCYNQNTADGATLVGNRMYMYASFLLTYNPQYAIFQTAMASKASTGGTNFRVFPETGFVPMNPSIATVTQISDLKLSTGVYERKYGSCYYRGSGLGSCAIIVNPDPSNSYTVTTSGYTRAAVLSGDGVLDGGTMTFTGSPKSILGPTEAEILVQ